MDELIRVVLGALRLLLKFALFAAGLTAVVIPSALVFVYFQEGPWTPSDEAEAAMTRLANVDLGKIELGLGAMQDALGAAENISQSTKAKNVKQVRWYRGAIRALSFEGRLIEIEVRDDTRTELILIRYKPVFKGTVYGLRLGGLPPDANTRARLKQITGVGVGWE
jgi:hypothetical protein